MLRKTSLKLAVCVLACIVGAPGRPAAQSPAGRGKGADLAQLPLQNIQIEADSVEELVAHIAFACNIPVGLEVAQDENAGTRTGRTDGLLRAPVGLGIAQDEDMGAATYQLNLKKGKLSDLLTQFVTEHDRYTWQIDGGVVSIFPKDGHRDPLLRELLATEVSNFSVKEKTDCQTFAQSLLNAPEVKKTLEGYALTYDTGRFGGFYIQQLGQSFSLNLSNVQLKEILDRVVKESPVAKTWVIKRDAAVQKLSLNVKARPEDPSNTSQGADARHHPHRAVDRLSRGPASLPLEAAVLVLLRAGRRDEVERRLPGWRRAGAAREEGGHAGLNQEP